MSFRCHWVMVQSSTISQFERVLKLWKAQSEEQVAGKGRSQWAKGRPAACWSAFSRYFAIECFDKLHSFAFPGPPSVLQQLTAQQAIMFNIWFTVLC